jgi:hypothetical protein
MRCSPDTNGCAACLACGILCRVTDRVSGETMVRGEIGHMKALIFRLKNKTALLEEQIQQLQQKNSQLQQQMERSYDSYMDQCEVCVFILLEFGARSCGVTGLTGLLAGSWSGLM